MSQPSQPAVAYNFLGWHKWVAPNILVFKITRSVNNKNKANLLTFPCFLLLKLGWHLNFIGYLLILSRAKKCRLLLSLPLFPTVAVKTISSQYTMFGLFCLFVRNPREDNFLSNRKIIFLIKQIFTGRNASFWGRYCLREGFQIINKKKVNPRLTLQNSHPLL